MQLPIAPGTPCADTSRSGGESRALRARLAAASLALALTCCAGIPPRATAQRSSFATDNSTTWAGTFETELGLGAGPRSDRDLTTALKYGVDEFTEVFVCGQAFIRERSGGEVRRGRSATNLGWRHRAVEWESGAAGWQALVLLPDGSEREGFASGETDVFLSGILDGYGEQLAFTAFYQLGSLGADGATRDTQHALSLVLGGALHEQVDGFAEVFGEFTRARSENPVAAQLGVAWNAHPTRIWDLAVQLGLNDDAPSTRVFLGLTWNLGRPGDEAEPN